MHILLENKGATHQRTGDLFVIKKYTLEEIITWDNPIIQTVCEKALARRKNFGKLGSQKPKDVTEEHKFGEKDFIGVGLKHTGAEADEIRNVGVVKTMVFGKGNDFIWFVWICKL